MPYFSNGARDDLIQRRYARSGARRLRSRSFGATHDEQSGLAGLWRAHDRAVRDPSVDLGRAALSGISRRDRRLERRRRTGRPGTGSPAGSAARRSMRWSARCSTMPASATPTSRRCGESRDGYVIDRPMSPRAVIEPLALAYAFDATPRTERCASARAAARRSPSSTRTISCLPDDARAGAADCARRKPNCRAKSSLGFTDAGSRLPPRRGDVAPAGRRRGARARMPTLRSSPTMPRRSGAPISGCRICGPGARAPISRCRRARWRSTPGDVVAARRRAAAGACSKSATSSIPSCAASRRAHRSRCVRAAARRRRADGARHAAGARTGSGRGARSADAAGRRSAGACAAGGVRQSVAGPVAIWRSLDGASFERIRGRARRPP